MSTLVMLLLLPFTAMMNGLALTVLWRWFVMPVFSLPPLTIPQALGIALVVAFLTHQTESDGHSDGIQRWVNFLYGGLIRPLFALGLGAIYLLFM